MQFHAILKLPHQKETHISSRGCGERLAASIPRAVPYTLLHDDVGLGHTAGNV